MEPLVNFKKRGIALPPGCKDLADLLALKKQPIGWPQSFPGVPWVSIPKSEEVTITEFAKVEPFIQRLLSPAGAGALLWLTAAAPEIFFTFCLEDKTEKLWLSASADCAKAPGWERSIREFFDHRGIPLSKQFDFSNAATPGRTVSLTYALPAESCEVTQIITDMLREVYEVTQGFEIKLLYHPPTPPVGAEPVSGPE
jgi:hypothetical protein